MALQLQEWQSTSLDTLDFPEVFNLTRSKYFNNLAEHVRLYLGGGNSPLEISNNFIMPKGFAGITVLDGIPVEFVPKYVAPQVIDWKDDLLYLIVFSKHGHLLLNDRIGSHVSEANKDLNSLIAESILEMYFINRRTPLRQRVKRTFRDFSYEGDINFEEYILEPSSDGFLQDSYVFSLDNPIQATIKKAIDTLSANVRDPSLKHRLNHFSAQMGHLQSKPTKRKIRLPNRLKCWQTLYDLCFDICDANGVTLRKESVSVRGFLVNMWQVWEDLISKCLSLAFGFHSVKHQSSHAIGTRTKLDRTTDVCVVPDSVLYLNGKPIVVDAKYKGKFAEYDRGISAADLYELMAFMSSVNSELGILIYPETAKFDSITGNLRVIEKVQITGKYHIVAVALQINGFANVNGLVNIVSSLRDTISNIAGESLISID
ncbi:TPA: 5-methylcytosine restriction system specificity protein McrC [Vibrio parahaemolyticus]|uniref:5-methylcytosine restriction system specificity protein McrC n=1 Tax=Vibrio parahaemolyticus TaxID=670 RepID=UPI0004DF1F12|nr:hypothetical protein [Vibrio parahaemolyticus]